MGDFARERMGDGELARALPAAVNPQAALDRMTKAATPGLELNPAWTIAAQAFASDVRATTVPGRLQGVRRVPFLTRSLYGSIQGLGAGWRREGTAIPCYPIVFEGIALAPLAIGGIATMSSEFAELAVANTDVAMVVGDLLQSAIAKQIDSLFVSDDAAVTDVSPAGIANGARSVTSTSAAADPGAMFAEMTGGGVSPTSAQWVLSGEALGAYSAARLLDGNGSTMMGLPIIVTTVSGTVLLIAGEHVTIAGSDEATIRTSESALIEQSTAPTGNIVVPTAASQSRVSMFQADSVAVRASVWLNWTVHGPSDSSGHYGVIELVGASYA